VETRLAGGTILVLALATFEAPETRRKLG
jgi:hypothetical protein